VPKHIGEVLGPLRPRGAGIVLAPLLARYATGGPACISRPSEPPFASVTYGAGGVSYAFYRLGRSWGDLGLLRIAGEWLDRAFDMAAQPNSFYDSSIGVEESRVGKISLFHTASGLYCIAALLALTHGHSAATHHSVAGFIAHTRIPNDNPDLTLGAAGLLLGCAELIEAAPATSVFELGPVRERGDEIAAELLQILRSEDIATSTRISYVGVAHGWAGLLFAVLRWDRALRREPDPLIAAKLDELATLAFPIQGGMCWTVLNNSRTFIPGWCNGNSGHVMLYALAFEVLGNERYRTLAVESAKGAWMFKSADGSLCCGNGGNGYAFLAAHRITGDGLWLRRARYAARRAAIPPSEYHFQDALYQGALGVSLLSAELESPATAAMPFFEPTRYPA
jgi:hypothetical protein